MFGVIWGNLPAWLVPGDDTFWFHPTILPEPPDFERSRSAGMSRRPPAESAADGAELTIDAAGAVVATEAVCEGVAGTGALTPGPPVDVASGVPVGVAEPSPPPAATATTMATITASPPPTPIQTRAAISCLLRNPK